MIKKRFAISGALLLTFALTIALPSTASAGPMLTLSPSSGAAGTSVDVIGSSFPGRTSGRINLGTTTVATFQTSRKGTFTATFEMPSRRTGMVALNAIVGSVTATASFTVTSASTTTTTATPPPPSLGSERTWAPPNTAGYTNLVITGPGTYNLYSNVDYVVSAPNRIDGAVHLRGGRNVVWIRGHIHIPFQGAGSVPPANRRALVVSDIDDGGGDPVRYGYSQDGRVVHIEGLLVNGPDLAEGINTNAPRAIVQLENIRVEGVHFRNSDDRDGTNGWTKNHPDVLQIWGSQKELRVDGLTGTSAYQGLYLQEDSPDRALGPIRLRRVNLRAYETVGDDGSAYAGHRMLNWVGPSVGTLHLDPGTVWVNQHANSGWNQDVPNPAPETGFWRSRYWNSAQSRYVAEPPPGAARFTDALGSPETLLTGADAVGAYARWSSTQVRDWAGTSAGRVYSGAPASGDYVPAGMAGLSYVSPGYGA